MTAPSPHPRSPIPRARVERAARWLRSAAATPYLSWLLARILAAGAFAVALLAADELLDGGRPTPLSQELLAWDGAFYADIAEHGYDDLPPEALRFFPLLPLLGRVASLLFLGNVDMGVVTVANVGALAAGVLLYRLVRFEGGGPELASRSVWLLALFPAAFVLVLAYSEGIALALAIGGFLALRHQRWWTAAALGAALALCRPVGVLFALPATVEAVRGLATASWRDRVGRVAAVVAPFAALSVYLLWVEARFGVGTLPLRAHERDDLRGDFVFPLTRIGRAFGDLLGGADVEVGLHALFIALFLTALVAAFRRLPVSYGLYAAALLLVAVSAESLGSFERYGLVAFPLFVGLADLTRHPALERSAVLLSGAGLTAFGALVLLAVFVP